ncbi:CHAT domain-containing protein [Candidatus Eisenbacteria bacterium]|uniref:CHAT domain-containing protein n=1 Tax=Eiseniibacteriota bacterium TaxID=2212470 RepID=A0ABV6YIQ7_UNCEI
MRFQARDALAEIEKVLPEARAGADSSFLLALLVRKGELHSSFGQARASEPILSEAIALAETLADSLALCEGLRWLGLAMDAQGRVDEAVALYNQLLQTAEACESELYRGWALVGLAWRDKAGGDNASSARRHRQAVTHFEEAQSSRGQSWAWNGLGMALDHLGEYDEALTCYRRAAAIGRASSDVVIESMAENNLGALTDALGDPGTALEHFERARVLQLEMGYARGAMPPALNIVRCNQRLGRFDAAQAGLRALLAECRKEHYLGFEGKILNSQADLELSRDHLHRASELYQQTILLGQSQPLNSRAEAHIGLALTQSKLGKTEDALETLEKGRDEISGLDVREQALMLDGESGACLQKLGRHREALKRLQYVERKADDFGLSGYRVKALGQAAASYRALGFADSSLALLQKAATVWEAERGLSRDPEWREQRGVSGHLIYTDLAAQLLAPREGFPEKERQREAFEQLQIFKARTLLERMLGPGKRTAALADEPHQLALERLQTQVLRDGELVLDFYLGPNVSFLFAVTRTECRVVTLPPERQLQERLLHYHSFISDPPTSEEVANKLQIVHASGRRLSRLLFGEIEDMLGIADLVFLIPDGMLNLLAPNALMPQLDLTETNWARIPSASVLAGVRTNQESKTPIAGKSVLVVAGCRDPGSGTLPGARREAEMLVDGYRHVDLCLLEDENRERPIDFGLQDLVPYDLLHLAAHARVDDQYPWQSAIRLVNADRDDCLSAADIAATRLNARLAVLAACESAGGRVLSGEGVLGLAGAFLSAGVPAIVATLWPVDDTQTTRLMEHFYSGLAAGLDAATALESARRAIRATPATSHPFFWAGYILVGDGRIDVELERRRPRPRFFLGFLGVSAVSLLLLSFLRRGS